MRWFNLILLFIVISVVVVINFFFLPVGIKMAIEKGGSAIVGAKVEVDKVKFSLFNFDLSLYNFKVTNPDDTMKNIIDIDRLDFHLNLRALVEAKFVVDSAVVDNLKIQTERSKDGALKKHSKHKKEKIDTDDKNSIVSTAVNQASGLVNTNLFSDIENFDYNKFINDELPIINSYQNFVATQEKTFREMESKITNLSYQNDIKKIENDIKKINIKEKNVTKIKKNIDTLVNAKKRVDKIYSSFNKDINYIKNEINSTDKAVRNLKKETENSINEVMKKLDFSSVSVTDMTEILLSSDANYYIKKATGFYNKYIPYYNKYVVNSKHSDNKKDTIKEQKKKFGARGYNVNFPTNYGYPDIYIKQMTFTSSHVDQQDFSFPAITGTISEISSSPEISGKPLSGSLDIDFIEPVRFKAGTKFSIDRQGGEVNDSFDIYFREYSIDNLKLPVQNPVLKGVKSGILSVDGRINAGVDRFNLTGDIKIDNLNPDFNKPSNVIFAVIIDVLREINSVELNLDYLHTPIKSYLKLSSSLDKLIGGKVKDIFNKKINELTAEFRKRYNTFVNQKLNEYVNPVLSEQSELNKLINLKNTSMLKDKKQLDKLIDSQKAEIEKYRKKLENEVENKVKDSLGDIPSIF